MILEISGRLWMIGHPNDLPETDVDLEMFWLKRWAIERIGNQKQSLEPSLSSFEY